ncbi:GrpB family protein [Deinococcus apachensis]|uniref:GrpB family protein n=1 Tax=Deinococcus apachensis TaxID=309886 RepID=UPI00047782A8|nr:GrpB family protein [Deinococcus apachensis]
MNTSVLVLRYDRDRPGRYAAESHRIRAALGHDLAAIEHIGSTSIPGLVAKPTIDLLVGVGTLPLPPRVFWAFWELGYVHMPGLGTSERLFFGRGRGTPEPYNVHVVVPGSAVWKDNLAFRDFLRTHPQVASEYAEIKRWAAQDPPHYGERKSPFIEATLEQARAWAGRSDA